MSSDVIGAGIDQPGFLARALLVGERIDVRAARLGERLANQPALVPLAESLEDQPAGPRRPGGIAVVFRYGALVLLNVPPPSEREFLEQLRPWIQHPLADPETEQLSVRVEPEGREGMDGAAVVLRQADLPRLQLLATVLSKSVLLGRYETDVAAAFDQIEPLAEQLQRGDGGRRGARQLLRHIGTALLSQHRMIGRAEVREKPELLWERPELEPLYQRLADELELVERHTILERKLELISRTAETCLELLHTRRSLRLEWYIVILIVVEIVLFVYELSIKSA
ncbi:MAG: RMD1 family protein [Pirellulaceae bacterium]|nr:RMD1 family protein [Pirellulaceae bacterium]